MPKPKIFMPDNLQDHILWGVGMNFFCKKCHKFLGHIEKWEFRGFSNKRPLKITGMDLCQKCEK